MNLPSLLCSLVQNPQEFAPLQAEAIAKAIARGEASEAQIAAYLVALKIHQLEKSPTIISANSKIFLQSALTFEVPFDVVDIVGTGGDKKDTFNASTAAAIIVAGAGLKVAKHGSRSATSKCGSANLLEKWGCSITNVNCEKASQILAQSNFCFLFAQNFHPYLKYVTQARKDIGVPTMFNILGPLINPLNPKRLVLGVFCQELGPVFSECLRLNGVDRAMVVCGEEGLDEISPAGNTNVWELNNGVIKKYSIHPSDFGVPCYPLEEVRGGGPEENIVILDRLLRNQVQGAVYDFVLMNAAALLYVSGSVETFKEGMSKARESVSSGKALAQLNAFAALSL